MNLLSLRGVCKSFGSRKILQSVNLECLGSSIVTISGKSGSGKTTLLSIISGLLKPESGTVSFNGQNIYKWTELKRSDYRNKKIGFVFQSFNLLPDFTIYQNIKYSAILNYKAKEIRKNADYLCDYLGISDIKDQLPASISGGEKQRAAIARAIINNPDIVLADEPTGNLDPDAGKSIFGLFRDIQKKYGICFIIATHDKYIIRNSDICMTLKNGTLNS